MITAKEIEAAFRIDHFALLAKHKAELVISDDVNPFGAYTSIAEIWINTEFDQDGNKTSEGAVFKI